MDAALARSTKADGKRGLVVGCAFAIVVLGLWAPPAPAAPTASAGSDFEILNLHPNVLSHNGNFVVDLGSPSGTVSIGTRVSVQYQLEVPGYPLSAAAGQLRIPGTVASFPISNRSLTIHLSAANFTVHPGGSVSPVGSGATTLLTTSTFNRSSVANLSTQGFAVQASWPIGQYSVDVDWSWILTGSNGSQVRSPTSPWTVVQPTQLVSMAGTPPGSVNAGGEYPVCLAGPIAGRTFSVHLTTGFPVQTFSGPAVTVPTSAAGTYCWNTTVPLTFGPGSCEMHLWEYASVTYLLYQAPLTITSYYPVGDSSNGSYLVAVAALGAAGAFALIVWGASRARKSRNGRRVEIRVPAGAQVHRVPLGVPRSPGPTPAGLVRRAPAPRAGPPPGRPG